jgi:Ca-activated chloride channel family protein
VRFFAQLELREPWSLLLALLAVPVFLASRRAPGRVLVSSIRALPAARGWRTRLSFLPDALLALALVGLAVALAGPRAGDRSTRVHREGIAIVMAVDTSGSMRALDLSSPGEERTRLDAVKAVSRQFVQGGGGLRGRPDDEVGLVTFARYADTRCPLTLDHSQFAAIAEASRIVTRGDEDGTSIGDALALSVERLRAAPARSKVIVLLTDGVNNAGAVDPQAAARMAEEAGVKVYTIGAGTNGVAPVRVTDPFTGQSVLRGMPVEIDEALLQEIASTTGGQYFRATDAAALRQIYGQIDRLERTRVAEDRFLAYREYYGWMVALAMVSSAAALGLRGTWLRRLP